ncbi:MAG: protein of unknown function (DUF1802) [Phormidesmis priestleyi Ana]|uniref:Uncharacterized protein n=1 Tax=Phormidesmis priestleyi Ana TaxID=1666911 RepID=A0A0P7ZYD7_9CYAN|nr:MAG: protein of unknown function (DUF1802) [Phormidesmis priestleyi Ana]
MSREKITLSKALCLPMLDIEALVQGRTIAALSSSFRNPSHFLLCPVDVSLNDTQIKSRYRPDFLRSLRTSPKLTNPDNVTIIAWAKSKSCRSYSNQDDLATLSKLTAWSADYLQKSAQIHHKIFLLFLQVHRFPQPLELRMNRPDENTIGRYLSIPGTWSDQNTVPIIEDSVFAIRQKQLVKLSRPAHPALENLQTELVTIRENNLGAMSLDRDLRYFLGWSRATETQLYDSDLSWIQQITPTGCSNKEDDLKQLVRQSWIKLGCKEIISTTEAVGKTQNRLPSRLFDNHLSDADLSFNNPFSITTITIKCRANNHSCVTNEAIQQFAEQLPQQVEEQFTKTDLHDVNHQQLRKSIKILLTKEPLTDQAQQSAKQANINVMRPETLQRLSELKAQYPGAIDLFKLEYYLQMAPHGEDADKKINQFIEATVQQLKIRLAIIEAVKTCMDRTGQTGIETEDICAAYTALTDLSMPKLSIGEVHDILIELSSPVAGYLGRVQSERENEIFYFLRELSVEEANIRLLL